MDFEASNIELFPPEDEEKTQLSNVVMQWMQTDDLLNELTQEKEIEEIDLETIFCPANVVVENVYLAFMNAHVGQSSNEYKRRVNRMISYVTGSYTHVEMIFLVANRKTKKKYRIVSSVYMVLNPSSGNASRLRMVHKHEYHRPERWCFFRYLCDAKIRQQIYNYEHESRGKQFNQLGMFWNFMVPDFLKVDRNGKYVFCSEQIVRNLQHCEPDEYASLKPYATGPLELFEFIRHRLNRFQRVDEPCV